MTTFTKPVSVLLLDLEGTTTPIDFVYKILYPHAREHVKPYLEEHWESTEVQADVRALLQENADDLRRGLDPPLIKGTAEQVSLGEIVAYVQWLMDRDRKTTPLKSLQGKIWEAGYSKGELRGQVFEDVAPAFKRWREQLKSICIYSSGSVLAQRLMFANSEAGDLSSFIGSYFDTNIGPKQDADSYTKIAAKLDRQPSEIVFVSDRLIELDAAAVAGCEVLLCKRPGNDPQTAPLSRALVYSFDEVLP
ncbi:MAG: acireductone synthase [Acidobacteria bacterium]|nr:MAG: acireductone synthase [Acidobacteriota bacterium]